MSSKKVHNIVYLSVSLIFKKMNFPCLLLLLSSTFISYAQSEKRNGEWTSLDYFREGNSLMAMEKTDEAKVNYLKSVEDTSNSNSFVINMGANALADIYFKDEVFDSTLFFIKLAENNYLRGCSRGEYVRKLNVNYKLSQCFLGINELDSAITYLLPYTFDNKRDVPFMDSLEFRKIQDYYLFVLRQKYDSVTLNKIVKKGVQELYYKAELDSNLYLFYTGDSTQLTEIEVDYLEEIDVYSGASIVEVTEVEDFDPYYFQIQCFLYFDTQKIILRDGICSSHSKIYIREVYKKAYILENIKQSYIYRQLTNG